MIGTTLSFNENDEFEDAYLKKDDPSKTFEERDDVVDLNSGRAISYNYVYKKIGQLIDNGNAALQILNSIDPGSIDPSTMGATASLINSLRGCISEFTKIHQQYIKFQNAIQLQQLRLKNRKEFYVFRNNVANGKDVQGMKQSTLIESKTSDIIGYLRHQEELKEKQKEKELNK